MKKKKTKKKHILTPVCGSHEPSKTYDKNFSANVRVGALSHKIDHLNNVLYILNHKGHQNCIIGSKVTVLFLIGVTITMHFGTAEIVT